MTDTTPEVAEDLRRRILALSPGRRLAMACEMFQTAKALARAGILQHGPLPESEVRCQLFLRFYGNDFNEEQRTKILEALRNS